MSAMALKVWKRKLLYDIRKAFEQYMKKTKRIGIVYDPLNISTTMTVRGGSLTQTHCAETGEYIPDRSLTPLVIRPEVYVNDPDGLIGDGKAQLTGILWYEIPQDMLSRITDESYITGELSGFLITGQSEGYSVGQDGTLTVTKNIPYLEPKVLVFTASYPDTRSGRILRIQATATLSTLSLAEAASLILDKPSSFVFNPIEDSGIRTIKASFLLGGKEPDSERCKVAYWWYKTVDGKESPVDPEEDLFYVDGQDSDTLTIDPRYIDGQVKITCKSEYALPGEALPSSPSDDCLLAETTVVRRYPEYDFEHFVHGGVEVSPDAEAVKNECVITCGRKVIDNPTRFFSIKWSIKKAVYGADWMDLGYGESIMIPAEEFANASDVALEVDELEPLGALCEGGAALCDIDEIITL